MTYNCSHCEFNLCIKCSSLPLTKEAEVHEHSLTLMLKLFKFSCDRCAKEGNGMFYFCAPCSFVVHPDCTSLPSIEQPLTLETEIHDHPLTLLQKSFTFTCNACGRGGSSMFYFCNMCSFVAHSGCTSLPLVVKVIRHKHPLNLTYSFPATQSSRVVCKLCVDTVNTNYAIYYCSSCDFVAHPHCATSKEDRDETFMQNFEDREFSESSKTILEYEDIGIDEYIGSSTFIVKMIKVEVDGIEIATKIKYFSHEHDLELIDKHGINEKCDGCVRSIFPPFYTCAQCGFFLHKSCVELSRKIRHPLHQHPLMLLPRSPHIQSFFVCNACHHICNGFLYHCGRCDFHLDVQCSLIPYMFKHACHEHQLILSTLSYYRKCSCCNSSQGYKFRCADCDFIVDFKCLTLPYTIRYREHEHPFTLCYTPEDESGEYFCDICEEKRDPKRWFYYCADCLYPTHPKCIHGNLLNVKFEKACTFDIHQHPLTLVPKIEHEPLCKKCGKACTNPLSYECVKCNFNFHAYCLRPSTTL
ncbi:hypothetical protein F2P56_034393 [Juglans regia]|uniref:Zinc finger PHD-type domain-containing protein n=2 Tax=Juglans regia TaxID=51240 RepID=A0A833U1Y2_JUGRE|nr:hypothetical protein F2P56_034393 [Juglans regia]